MKNILLSLLFVLMALNGTLAQDQLAEYPEGFFVVSLGNGQYIVCCNQIGSYFKLITPPLLVPDLNESSNPNVPAFKNDDYTMQVLFVNKSRLPANKAQNNFALVQSYIDWEKSYLEDFFKITLHPQIAEKNNKPAFAIWSYMLKPVANQPEKSFYYYTTTDGNLVVSVVFQFHKKTDLQTFKKIASETIKTLVFVPNPISPADISLSVVNGEKTKEIVVNSKTFFEGRFMVASNAGLKLISTDGSSLNDLFRVIESKCEELEPGRRIITMIVRDPLLQKKDETRLLFEKGRDANGPIIILRRAAYNGIEAENDADLYQTAQLLYEGSLNARNKNKN